MQRKRSMIACLLLIIILLFCTGCWDRRDPEIRAYVLATAFDYEDDEQRYKIIVQIAHAPGQVQEDEAGGGAGYGEDRAFWVLSAYGRTPFHARENLMQSTSRELFWGHNIVTLFSENVAKHGLGEAMDFLERNRQVRLISRPLIVEGDLRKLLEAEYPLEETGARGLQRQVTTLQFDAAFFPTLFLSNLYNTLEQPGIEMFIGKAEVLHDDVSEKEEDEEDGMTLPPAQLGGGAAFIDDEFAGWFEPHETVGWQFLKGTEYEASYFIPSPDNPADTLGLEVIIKHKDIYPVFDDDEVRIHAFLECTTRVQEYTGERELAVEDEFIESLRQASAEAFRSDVEKTLARSQELGADILGFGNLIYRKHPEKWQELEDDWRGIYRDLVVDVDVEVTIRKTGLITSPASTKGE